MLLNKNKIDFLGLSLLGCLSFGYVLWNSHLAEAHLLLPFLNFPVFIGEIFLFLCFILFFLKYPQLDLSKDRLTLLVTFYFFFVIMKALYGYFKWGPLAFRNAALMYYPFCAVLTYSFYKGDFFKQGRAFLFVLLLVIFCNAPQGVYWILTCGVLGFVICYKNISSVLYKICLLALFILIPYKYLFTTSRMMILSNFISLVYILWAVIVSIRGKAIVKYTAVTVFLVAIGILLASHSNLKGIQSMFSLDLIKEEWQNSNRLYQERLASYRPSSLKVNVYNPNINAELHRLHNEKTALAKRKLTLEECLELVAMTQINGSSDSLAMLKGESQGQQSRKCLEDFQKRSAVNNDPAAINKSTLKIGNILFRLYIWMDMFEELLDKKPVLGFDYGKPFRSKRLEVLNWGPTEWKRDGWIAAHNSYLHIIYRSGVIGVALIIFLVGNLIRTILFFKQKRDLSGLLLCAIIINWFVAANFLLIFELPYTAIPIWCLYGLIMAYAHDLKMRHADTYSP